MSLEQQIMILQHRFQSQAIITEQQSRINQMLESQIQDLKENNHHQINQSTSPSQIISSQERLPTLGKFYDNRAVRDEWYLQVEHKPIRDGAAIGDEFDQFMYLFSRLDGDAMKMFFYNYEELDREQKRSWNSFS